MGITFAEFLMGKTVKTKSGSLLKIEDVASPRDIVGRVVFPGSNMPSLSKMVEHVTLLDLDASSLQGAVGASRQQ